MAPRIAVVVAKYRECLAWVAGLPTAWQVFVYDKSDGSIPNVGREAETYARFVVEHYDELAANWDAVAFLQGDPFGHVAALPGEDGIDATALTWLGAVYTSGKSGEPHHHGLPVAQRHAELFGCDDERSTWDFAAGAQYVVPVASILARGKSFWHRLHALLAREAICAWTMERLWAAVFTS